MTIESKRRDKGLLSDLLFLWIVRPLHYNVSNDSAADPELRIGK